MGISLDASTKIVSVTSPTTSVTVQELVNTIRDWEDEQENLAYAHVIDAVGKADLGGGVTTGITMTLSSLWQIQFWNGVSRGTLKDGNVVGGVGGIPVKNTGGNDTISQLSAVATTIATASGTGDWTSSEKEQIRSAIGVDGSKAAIVDSEILDGINSRPSSADIADAVWDEILTGATHNITNSAGKRVRQIGAFAIQDGTAQAGTSNSITLAATANGGDGIYNRNLIVLVDNTGKGQTRTIVDYDDTTKVCVIDRDWRITPDNTTAYQIVPDDTPLTVDHGVARGGTSNTITIRTYASSVDDAYLCNIVTILSGTGRGQARLVGSYNGTTNVVTVCGDDWVTIPDATSVYAMMPYGVACAACMGDVAIDEISDGVWDEDLTTHTTSKSSGWFVQKIKAIADAILAMVT